MIAKLSTEEAREMRLKLYKDDVFLIAHEALNGRIENYRIEELFVSSEILANRLIKNNIVMRSLLSYEVEDIRQEMESEKDFYILLTITYIKLSALRKSFPIAEQIAREFVVFCQQYEEFYSLLKALANKEIELRKNKTLADLYQYKLKTLVLEQTDTKQAKEIINEIIEICKDYSVEVAQDSLFVLKDLNEIHNHAFDNQIKILKDIIKKKSTPHTSVNMPNGGTYVENQIINNNK